MKKINKSEVPLELIEYFDSNPNEKWETFKNESQDGYKKVISTIKQDQGGLCCYCETNFVDRQSMIRDDFRVEHFHPKSDSTIEKNWDLDWKNLLGCCHGGSDKTVHQGNKFIEDKKHRHSDILKDDKNWDDEILNPITEIPAFPPLFRVDLNGTIQVNEENCTDENIKRKALNCIDPQKLNLNSYKLKEFRGSVIDTLHEQMSLLMADGQDMKNIVNTLVETHLSKKEDCYAPFFSTIRSFFKEDAEAFLKRENFNG